MVGLSLTKRGAIWSFTMILNNAALIHDMSGFHGLSHRGFYFSHFQVVEGHKAAIPWQTIAILVL